MNKLKQELERYDKEVVTYLTASNAIAIVQLDLALNILDCNLGFMQMFNPRQNPAGEQLSDYIAFDANEIRSGQELRLPCSLKTGMEAINYCYLIQTENGYLLFCERQLLTESRALEQIGSMNDELINLQREAVKKNYLLEKLSKELDERVVELEATLAKVKELEGIIPICSYCKKIRDDESVWQQMETYISAHSEALFSHGVCPECYAEQMKLIRNSDLLPVP